MTTLPTIAQVTRERERRCETINSDSTLYTTVNVCVIMMAIERTRRRTRDVLNDHSANHHHRRRRRSFWVVTFALSVSSLLSIVIIKPAESGSYHRHEEDDDDDDDRHNNSIFLRSPHSVELWYKKHCLSSKNGFLSEAIMPIVGSANSCNIHTHIWSKWHHSWGFSTFSPCCCFLLHLESWWSNECSSQAGSFSQVKMCWGFKKKKVNGENVFQLQTTFSWMKDEEKRKSCVPACLCCLMKAGIARRDDWMMEKNAKKKRIKNDCQRMDGGGMREMMLIENHSYFLHHHLHHSGRIQV